MVKVLQRRMYKMTKKPFTHENCMKGFSLAKHLTEIILFLILAIQLVEEFFEFFYFTHITIILSNFATFIFIFGISYKYMTSISEDKIYVDQSEIVSYYDNFLGSILIPMVFLFDMDNGIFIDTTIKNLDLAKTMILIVAFVSAFFSRFILRLAEKYSLQTGLDDTYKKSPKGSNRFDVILVLNGFNGMLNFVLCCFFWYISMCMKWANDAIGSAVLGITLMMCMCAAIAFFFEDKKHIRLIIAVIITVVVTICLGYSVLN